jgi:nitrogen fixation protein FixH
MSTLKIGWGTRIALLYGGFVLVIATLVIGSFRQDFDLVSSDYYDQELRYQEVIDAGKNQADLSGAVALAEAKDKIVLTFPREFAGRTLAGTVTFYSPVDATWDRTFDISAADNQMTIPVGQLHKTAYNVRIKWSAGDKSYYQETAVSIKP